MLQSFTNDAATDQLQERERIGPEEGMKGIALHNPGSRLKRPGDSLRRGAAAQASQAANRRQSSTARHLDRGNSPPDLERMGISAGVSVGALFELFITHHTVIRWPSTLSFPRRAEDSLMKSDFFGSADRLG